MAKVHEIDDTKQSFMSIYTNEIFSRVSNYNDARQIVDSFHKKGNYIYCDFPAEHYLNAFLNVGVGQC